MQSTTPTLTKNTRLATLTTAPLSLLLIPLIAMQFSSGVDWKAGDFLVMGVLLALTGLGCEMVLRKVRTTRNRILVCGAVVLAFLLVWAELAVGIFGSPFAGS